MTRMILDGILNPEKVQICKRTGKMLLHPLT